jgi:hypothetical protein
MIQMAPSVQVLPGGLDEKFGRVLRNREKNGVFLTKFCETFTQIRESKCNIHSRTDDNQYLLEWIRYFFAVSSRNDYILRSLVSRAILQKMEEQAQLAKGSNNVF